jgi:hypothetical protein
MTRTAAKLRAAAGRGGVRKAKRRAPAAAVAHQLRAAALGALHGGVEALLEARHSAGVMAAMAAAARSLRVAGVGEAAESIEAIEGAEAFCHKAAESVTETYAALEGAVLGLWPREVSTRAASLAAATAANAAPGGALGRVRAGVEAEVAEARAGASSARGGLLHGYATDSCGWISRGEQHLLDAAEARAAMNAALAAH